MDIIIIKPHHFMDIIKLYGFGIDVFVPDEKMHHDFYRFANAIIQNPHIKLQLTKDGDYICQPCIHYHHHCLDSITHISSIVSKETYNQLLDQRIIDLYALHQAYYSAYQLCQIFYQNHELIFKIWQEEDYDITQQRHDYFVVGAKKYIQK